MKKLSPSFQLIKVGVQTLYAHKKLWLFEFIMLILSLLFIMGTLFLINYIFQISSNLPSSVFSWLEKYESFIQATETRSSEPVKISLKLNSTDIRSHIISYRLWLFIPLYFSFYLLSTVFVALQLNLMLSALNGNKVSFSSSILTVFKRSKSLLIWMVYHCTIGIIILLFKNTPKDLLGTFSLLKITRSNKSHHNPFKVDTLSAELIKPIPKSYYIGFGLIYALITAGILLMAVTMVTLSLKYLYQMPIILLICAISLLTFMLILNAVICLYRVALYIYATEGVLPDPYARELFQEENLDNSLSDQSPVES